VLFITGNQMKVGTTIIKNSGVLILKQLFLMIIALFATAYIARSLGEVYYGKFAFAFAFVVLFRVVGEMGIYALTVREVAADKAKAGIYLGDAIIIRMALSFFMLGSIALVINVMNYPEDTTTVVYIAAGALFFDSLSKAFQSIMEGHQRMEYVAFIHSIISLVQASFAILILYIGFKLIPLALVYLGVSVLGFLLSYLITTKKIVLPIFTIDVERLKYTIKNAFPFAIIALFTLALFKIDIVMLSFFKGDAAVGWYNAAAVLTYNTIVIASALSTSIFPALSGLGRENKDAARNIFEKSFSFLIFIGLPIAIGTTFTAKQIIMLIFGEQYAPSVLILQVIIWYIPFVYVGSLMANVLNAYACQKYVAKTAGIQAVTNILFNLYMIPLYGPVGAAIATVVTEVLGVGILYFRLRHFFSFSFISKIVPYLVFSNAVLVLFLSIMSGWSLAVIVPSSITIYFLILLQSGLVNREDLNIMKKINY